MPEPSRKPCCTRFLAGLLVWAETLWSLAACNGDQASAGVAELNVVADSSTSPLANLESDWQARFNSGNTLFNQVFLPAQGLGPVYIRAACDACHANDARGPGTVRKMVLLDDHGVPLADQSGLPYGHTVRPQAVGDKAAAILPPDDLSHVLLTTRMPPAVFGRGYLEAIRDDEIERVEAEQAQRSDGVNGHINWVSYASDPNPDTRFHAHRTGDTLIGRFGLKARIATLDDFVADAFQGDMGLTSDMRTDELPNPIHGDDALPGLDLQPDTLNEVADYVRLLRIPFRPSGDMHAGAKLFAEVQCDVCHTPSLHTAVDYPIAELADIDAPVYTDLLVHDMGSSFADGVSDYGAASSEWRTAPLLGLRFLHTYLHDGRAKTLADAIEQHAGPGSQAATSIDHFHQLADVDRAALLQFVSDL